MFRLGDFAFLRDDPPPPSATEVVEGGVRGQCPSSHGAVNIPDGLDSMVLTVQDPRGCPAGSVRLVFHEPGGLKALGAARPKERVRFRAHIRPAEVRDWNLTVPGSGWFRECRSLWHSFDRDGGPISDRGVVAIGLAAALLEAGRSRGVTDYLALCPRAMPRLLERAGFRVRPIGPVVEGRAPLVVRAGDAVGPVEQWTRWAGRAVAHGAVPTPVWNDQASGPVGSFVFGSVRFFTVTGEDRRADIVRLRGFPTDVHDAFSVHAVAISRDNALLATARLTRQSPAGFSSLVSAAGEARWALSSSKKIGEVSGLGVASELRRYWGLPPEAVPRRDQRRARILVMGLLRLLYRVSLRRRLSAWCFLADKDSVRLMARHGLRIHRLGGGTGRGGRLAPHLIKFHEAGPGLHEAARLRNLARDLVHHPAAALFPPGGS